VERRKGEQEGETERSNTKMERKKRWISWVDGVVKDSVRGSIQNRRKAFGINDFTVTLEKPLLWHQTNC
jgi:hypothetical protein